MSNGDAKPRICCFVIMSNQNTHRKTKNEQPRKPQPKPPASWRHHTRRTSRLATSDLEDQAQHGASIDLCVRYSLKQEQATLLAQDAILVGLRCASGPAPMLIERAPSPSGSSAEIESSDFAESSCSAYEKQEAGDVPLHTRHRRGICSTLCRKGILSPDNSYSPTIHTADN